MTSLDFILFGVVCDMCVDFPNAAVFQYSSTVARMRPPPATRHPGDKLCSCSLCISRFLRILVTSLDFILLGVVCDTCVDMPKHREETSKACVADGKRECATSTGLGSRRRNECPT